MMYNWSLTQDEKNLLKIDKLLLDKAQAIPSLTDVRDSLDMRIEQSRVLLQSAGIDPGQTVTVPKEPRLVSLRSFDSLLAEAEENYPQDISFEDIFTQQEVQAGLEYIDQLNEEFNAVHRLDKVDILIPAIAGVVGGAVDCFFGGFVKGESGKNIPGTMTEWVRNCFNKLLPEERIKELEKIAKVTYDAQDNRNTTINVDGLSSWFHRNVSLGHDPLLGFIFGVIDMLRGTMTTLDFNGHFVIQVMENVSHRKAKNLFEAISKVFLHMLSDVNTPRGLPVPFMALFNKVQWGKVGDNDTIADLVKSMSGQGYDFRHFCSMSIPVMITEVIVRVSYFVKRLSEGYSFSESLPVGTSHVKKPKLGTMLWIAHSAGAAINVGKVAVTKQPLNINYPEWLHFTKYSIKQLRWVLLQKPAERDKYVTGIIDGNFVHIQHKMEELFSDYVFVPSH